MAYVTIDSDSNITGIFAMPQPQLDDFQVIDDDDARIVTFLTPAVTAPDLSVQVFQALVDKAILAPGDIIPATLATINNQLKNIGQPVIVIGQASLNQQENPV